MNDTAFHRHTDPKLKNRLRAYMAVSAVVGIVVIFNTVQNQVNFLLPLAGLAVGIGIGMLFSRMFHVSWDHGARRVILRLDTFGSILLIAYAAFELNRGRIVSMFVHGPAVFVVSFALLAGILFGRALGIRGRIARVLKEQRIFW